MPELWDGNVLSLSEDLSRLNVFVKDKTNKDKLAGYCMEFGTEKTVELRFILLSRVQKISVQNSGINGEVPGIFRRHCCCTKCHNSCKGRENEGKALMPW